MINSMLQRMNLSGEITKLSDKQFALVKEAVECYKKLREEIMNFIPFYPIGIPKYGDGWLCLGMKGKKCNRIAIWRMTSEKEFIEIPLNSRGDNVKVCYPMSSECEIKKTDKGIKVFLPQTFTAVLLEI